MMFEFQGITVYICGAALYGHPRRIFGRNHVYLNDSKTMRYLDIASFSANNTPGMDNWISRLYKDQMKHYVKHARPVIDHTHPTVVTLGLSLKNIHLTWKDEFLRWSPQDYMNIERLHFDDTDIWLPDITIYNSAEGSEAHPFGDVPVLVESRGQAFWFPPTHLRVKCDLDLMDWPRDEHECLVRMGSWAHHGEQIDIQILSHNNSYGVMTDTLEKNSRWALVNASANRSITTTEGHDSYVEVNFAFRVKRQASTHATYITQSTLALVVVVLATYLLPLHRFLSRLLMHLFALGVLITCFFTLFALLPANGGPVPLVVRYYSGSIILTTLSLLATLCLTHLPCCCCCSSSSTSLGKTLGSIATSPLRRNGFAIPQASSTTGSPYNHLESEVSGGEDEEDQRRPRATQLNQGSSHYTRLQDEADGGGGGVDRLTESQFLKVINFLVMTLFTIAFVVDYVVLRNVVF
ncbi:Neuronal acetylcholine receptor subunit alpha-7 [Chionoecetes opilio]|uniref:Neuronal acetylcholine receptor subunit alpha-7 n=1 Tax=Chionoecetes opilio TaxID=41210 RepID=A0A8J4XZ57_CHIOP|nr:Neuronal acetylcholine receptor subunit alpha-7 [Chionoecetes opilio]